MGIKPDSGRLNIPESRRRPCDRQVYGFSRLGERFSTDGVIAGFRNALVGQQVGSQVLVVIPPADGYGAQGQPSAGIGGTDTLVFVIDILDTTP